MTTRNLRVQDVQAWLADRELDAFTLDQVVDQFHVSRNVAYGLAQRMKARNQAFPLRPGLYLALPANYWGHPEAPLVADWYLVAKYLADPDPYFLAYYTAMEYHQMIQHPLATVFIATTRQKVIAQPRRNKKEPAGDLPVRFRFVTLAQRKFGFGHGPRQLQRGRAVEMADLERAFMDCADRLDLCGGIEEVVRGFARRHDDLERERLLRYLLELDQPVVTKRVGFLLEIVGHGDPRLMRELERLGGRLGNYALLVPGGGEPVERSKRWELDINADPDRLMAAVTT